MTLLRSGLNFVPFFLLSYQPRDLLKVSLKKLLMLSSIVTLLAYVVRILVKVLLDSVGQLRYCCGLFFYIRRDKRLLNKKFYEQNYLG